MLHSSIGSRLTALVVAASVVGVAACSGTAELAHPPAPSGESPAGVVSEATAPAVVPQEPKAAALPAVAPSTAAPVFDTPEDAAAHLFGAWDADDEASAALVGDSGVVEALFRLPSGTYGGSECREIAGGHYCYFEGDGQSLEFHVRNDNQQGYRVASIALLAHGSHAETPILSEDPAVLALQQRLESLGFWLGNPDGSPGNLTTQAVMAFQKANGLHPDGKAGPVTLEALQTAARPIPTSTADGIEIDLARQLMFVIADGGVRWVLNTSTGAPDTPTSPGEFTIERRVDGVREAPLGALYRPTYFDGGIAIHGSPSVPAYPASHGCARVSNAAMDMLWASSLVELGTPVRVV